MRALFVSDLHGSTSRYDKLFEAIRQECPALVFIGGDLFAHLFDPHFVSDHLIPGVRNLKNSMQGSYPRVYAILGNDDPRSEEALLRAGEDEGLWWYAHNRKLEFGDYNVYGYACVPPTPFRLKDWEKYDVSRYCDPGCVSPEEGVRTVDVSEREVKWGTIRDDLQTLAGQERLEQAVFLFHSPPYDTPLDRAALDGRRFEGVPLDVHIGSIAIRRFIESRQPHLTLHGHVHESARLTGQWKTQIGRTVCLGAAHDGPELALVRFDLHSPAQATRELL